MDPGSSHLTRVLQDATIFVSPLTWAEVHTTLARRLRTGDLDHSVHDYLAQAFSQDWRLFRQIMPGKYALGHVPRLARAYNLKGADALQCASALAIASPYMPVKFVCSDMELNSAAASEGLHVWDPTQAEL